MGGFLALLVSAQVLATSTQLMKPGIAAPTPVNSPVSVNFSSFQLGSNDIPLTSWPLVKTTASNDPEQIHITLGGPGEMYVTWATGNATFYKSDPKPPEPVLKSEVRYGLLPGNYNFTATGSSSYYIQNNTGNVANPQNTYYVSPLIHTVLLKGLVPSTTYYYSVGDPQVAWSNEYSFKTGPTAGEFSFPARIGLIADLGATSNSTVSLSHLTANKPEIALLVGDLVYADDYTGDGLSSYYYPDVYQAGSTTPPLPVNTTSYQPRWDGWGRFMQTVGKSTSVAFMTVAGNHEIERDSAKKVFQSWTMRYPNPYKQSASGDSQYYSFDYAGAHFVNIGAYEGPGYTSSQYRYPSGNYPHTIISQKQLAWLEADLKAVDRTKTPWIIAQTHPPFYNSYQAHYKEVECFQQQVEPVLYKYGVDFMFLGHVHAYERTNRVYNYTLDPCGTTHITIGDGGNIEGTYKQFVDSRPYLANCSVPLSKLNAPGNYAPLCASAQVYGPGNDEEYCPTIQPYWSAYREPSFGHGILVLKSPTEATFSWYRNQDQVPVETDSVTVVKNLTCPNQNISPRPTGE